MFHFNKEKKFITQRWHKLAAFFPKLQWRNSEVLAHEFSLEHSFNKLETLLSYKDETNLRHFARIALKKNCCHKKMTQTCSIFPKLQWRNSKVLAHEFSLEHSFNKLETLLSFSPWIFIEALFKQTWNIVVLQRWDKFATFCQNCIEEKLLP